MPPRASAAMAATSTSEAESIIECVAIFYEKGKCKLDYTRKERFRASIPAGSCQCWSLCHTFVRLHIRVTTLAEEMLVMAN